MKAVFFGCAPEHEAFLSKRIGERELDIQADFVSEKVDDVTVARAADAEIVSVFVGSPVHASHIEKMPKLKLLSTRSTGYDHLDVAEAHKRGIAVSYVPFYGENTVAEHAFGLLLALSKRIYAGYDQIREKGDFHWDELQGFDLKGKTIGIVGMGRIGFHAAKIARGFDMRVLAYDIHPNDKLAHEAGFTYVSLDELLSHSDIVTLHVSHNDTSHHLIDADALSKMKKGAILINTSRGAVVNTQALLAALQKGHLGGACLDVLEEEGIIQDEMQYLLSQDTEQHDLRTVLANHVLVDMPNVIVTPHIAFNTKEAVERILETTLDSIEAFMKGKPINLVPAA
ncbi:MAG: lactate dehydrogenase [Candidatus Campbellbacteria bacterium]